MLANQSAPTPSPQTSQGDRVLGAEAPWSASSYISNLPWSQGSHRGVQPMPLPCTDAMVMAATNPPVRKPCVAARIGWLQCAMRPPSNLSLVHGTLRGIVGSQDLHDGGFSCHVPPAPGPSAKPASPLSIRSTEKLSDLSLWTVIAPSRLHLLPVVCRTSHVFALCPPGTTDAHALHPHIRSRSHGVRS
jgi:hypothetical protein